MGSKLLLAGNVLALLTTLAAFLQLLSWPDAGLLIIASLMVTILLHTNSKKVQTSIPTVLRAVTPPQLRHEHHASPVQAQASETILQPKQTAPTTPTSAGPAIPRPAPAQPQVQTKPAESSGQTPSVIEKGDYLSLDMDLDAGKEMIGEVSADGIVNVYVLTEENLTSIDAGEEFWSEAVEEGVEEATVRFTASEKGTWFLVVENADDKDVTATVSVRIGGLPRRQSEPLKIEQTDRISVPTGMLRS